MPALFSRRATPLARSVLLAACAAVVAVPSFAMGWVRTPWARGEHRHITQPVPFDHRVHVTGLRIDCRFCHSGVETTAQAGLPPTQICVSCHQRLWLSLPPMSAVRHSVEMNQPIAWQRVNQLPDFVYFDHAMHVNKGVGCETCHGRVDETGDVTQAAPLTMGWCVSCHRDPAPHLRPLDAITTQGYQPAPGTSGTALMAAYHVRRLTNCTTCHR
ncbi:MAG TPA: cytochrome c3 family protein [Gemmatimonadaceae bacterium]|jgi:hypothetical protein